MTDEDFVFSNGGVTLGGTLTRPDEGGLAPGVVLISGSGANDRDETVCGHKPFAVIADYARAHGYAALRFDDRGVGASSGDAALTTFSDSVSDARTAFLALAGARGIDPARLALIGHSEGGLVAAAAAAMPDVPVRGVVMLASPAEPIEHLLHRQARVISEEASATLAQVAHESAMNAAVFEVARCDIGHDEALSRLTTIIQEFLDTWPERPAWSSDEMVEAARQMANIVGAPAYRSLLVQDPDRLLRAVDTPILALFGSLDTQVAAEPNHAAFVASTAGNPHAASHVFASLNHLFQRAVTGSITEYELLDAGPDTAVLDAAFGWLDRLMKRD